MSENNRLSSLWNTILEKAEKLIQPIPFSMFIKPLIPIDLVDCRIILKSSSKLNADTIMLKHADKLREAIERCDIGLTNFKLIVDGSSVYTIERDDDEGEIFKSVPLKKEFTFDSFVVGNSNKFVFNAAKTVADFPGDSFNPLFIYGESGLGKTHLLQAIANDIKIKHPEKQVLYTTCDNFLNGYIDLMIAGRMNQRDKSIQFRNHYRNVDILIIDDIQFLAKKPGVQEEFFHTFNELHSQNKQIVLTSDRPPKEIETLENRLRTRFEGGLITDIQPPDLETKIAILRRKAQEKHCVMPDDVLEFLASNSGHDVRTLEGRLNKVFYSSKLYEEPITLALAQKALNEAVPSENEESEEVTADSIISAVCGYYKFKKDELIGKSKKADLVKARHICAYLIYELLGLPLAVVGKIMGGKDHTTIINSRNKVEKLMRLNSKISKELDDIKNIIYKQ